MVLEGVYHNTVKLVPKNIALHTNRELPQYFIQKWQLTYMAQSVYLKILIRFINQYFRKHQPRSKDGDCLQEEAD